MASDRQRTPDNLQAEIDPAVLGASTWTTTVASASAVGRAIGTTRG